MDRGAWPSLVHGIARAGHNLMSKQQHQQRISLILTHINSKECFLCFLVGHIQTKSSLCGTVHLNCCWEKKGIHQLSMCGAVGKIGFLNN